MSITTRGVQFVKTRKNVIILALLSVVELALSIVLVVSLTAHFIFPQRADALNAGVPRKISYQGRLTDVNGNPLGGSSGTNYCFRFYVYDSGTGGTQIWPSGTAANTTVRVKDGVFSTAIGEAQSMSYDFSKQQTSYLQVQVNNVATTCSGTWETLDVRQRLDAVAYARTAEWVYSDLLKAASQSASAVQIGAGTGTTTPVYLGLDWNNSGAETVDASCTNNGQLWYNSADTKIRVCEGSVIRDVVDALLVKDEGTNQGHASTALDFTGAGVSASKGTGGIINVNIPFAGVAVQGVGTVSSGSVVFSNANGVTFGLNGSTITASVAAGAAGNPGSFYANAPVFTGTGTITFGLSQSYAMPFILPYDVSASYLRIIVSMATASTSVATTAARTITAGLSSTWNAVIYSQRTGANSLSLGSVVSGSAGFSSQWSLQANTAGSQWSITENVSFPQTGTQTNFTTSYAASTSIFSFNTVSLTAFSGTKFIDIPFANSLSQGNYWIVLGSSSNSGASASGTNFTGLRMNASLYVLTQQNSSIGLMGANTNASIQLMPGLGSFSTAGGGTTNSLNFSNISSSASHNLLYFQLLRTG